MSKYRLYYDGIVHILQKRVLFFFWKDVVRKVQTVDGIDFVEPFFAEEDMRESEVLKYFQLMKFNPDSEEPDYEDYMELEDDMWTQGGFDPEPVDKETVEMIEKF